MNNKIRELLPPLFYICDLIDDTPIGPKKDGMAMREVLKIDLMRYAMYLSSSDGTVRPEEAELINQFYENHLSPNQITRFIKENNIYSKEFENKVPLSLQICVAMDQYLADNGHSEPGKNSCTEVLLEAYENVGKEILACDERVSPEEMSDYDIYHNTLNKYIQENLLEKGGNSTSKMETGSTGMGTPESKSKTAHGEETIKDLLDELNSLTGLEQVKKEVKSIINLLQVRKIREERGFSPKPISMHLVFTGNPGTGKTTVARLLAKIYAKLGVLTTGQLIEVDRSGLVGGYVGQTALKVQEAIKSAIGGILFIDEAYSLTSNRDSNDYGQEAVSTLLKGMEDNRDNLIVIVAGYTNLMKGFLSSNPGLRARFNKFIHFPDYSPEEMKDIFAGMCLSEGFHVSEETLGHIQSKFEKSYSERNESFANGREVRNLFEKAQVNQANRLSLQEDISDDDLLELTIEDID